ncbi:Lnb N-terminal periplasmic domain-containing protein [Salinisphaera aquimarina]|uniref:DUF4105 domain-containing protein n=1 Tax=Salinisphaera aquimarina TaxID=2094031 RepID=A0ABV7ENM9_9GAMM
MKTALILVLMMTALVPVTQAAAAEPAAVSDARFAALAASPRWQALLHINQGATLRGIGASYVDDDDFFLSADGVDDPEAELRASWRALRAPHSAERCRFPARYRFLAEQLGWHEQQPLRHCSEYLKWRENMPTGQLVLVFPAAYLNSPSSMFGHTLLRLDATPDPESVWLSQAINFGAQTDGLDNSFFYIWRGLAGGYPGRFSVVPYAQKIREYAFLENRDMWEYALNLNADELDWVVRHLWELRNINFDYYFFDENCSFRLLELIKVGRPEADLMPDLRFAELPVNTVRALYTAGLVTERRYRPSKAKQLEHLATRLDGDELAWARTLMTDPEQARSAGFQAYAPMRRHLIAQVAYQALRLRHRKGARDASAARNGLALLRVVQRNPAPPSDAVPEPPAPERGHDTQMASIGAGSQDGAAFAEFGYRLTYHDILDPLSGFLPGAGIEGLDLRLRATEGDGLSLESLDLVNIRSLAPRGAFVKPISWFVHAGLEQAPVPGGRNLGAFIQGGPGASWQFGGLMPYAFAVVRAESVSGFDPDIALGGGTELGAVYVTPGVQLGAHARALYFTHDFYRLRTSLTADMPISTDNAVRADCAHETWREQGVNSCTVALRHYFN